MTTDYMTTLETAVAPMRGGDVALDFIRWYHDERAVDLSDTPTDNPADILAYHLVDVSMYLLDIAEHLLIRQDS